MSFKQRFNQLGMLLGLAALALPAGATELDHMLGSGNVGDGYTPAMVDLKINTLVKLHTPSTRFTTSDYWKDGKATPENMDWPLKKCVGKINGILLFEHYEKMFPLGDYAKWHAVGKAYAERFRPNSAWWLAQGVRGYGITMFEAINEPDQTYPVQTDKQAYREALKGLADGVHSVDKTLKVVPGGYAGPNARKDFSCNGYVKVIADLINDGTLDGIDLHTYFGFWTPIHKIINGSQYAFDHVKKAGGITRDCNLYLTEVGYGTQTAEGGKDKPKKISEELAASYLLTCLWDGLGVVGNKGQSVTQLVHVFTLVYEGNYDNPDLAYFYTMDPWKPTARALTVKLVADLLQGLRFSTLDPKGKGDYTLLGNGRSKKMWVWQNREEWSNAPGDSYTCLGIPKGIAALEVYGSAGLIKRYALKGESSYKVPVPEDSTVMIVAVAK